MVVSSEKPSLSDRKTYFIWDKPILSNYCDNGLPYMSGNLWLLMRKCSDIIFKWQRMKLRCYIFMQSCGMQQENEVPTQNIMETLFLCGNTK